MWLKQNKLVIVLLLEDKIVVDSVFGTVFSANFPFGFKVAEIKKKYFFFFLFNKNYNKCY